VKTLSFFHIYLFFGILYKGDKRRKLTNTIKESKLKKIKEFLLLNQKVDTRVQIKRCS